MLCQQKNEFLHLSYPTLRLWSHVTTSLFLVSRGQGVVAVPSCLSLSACPCPGRSQRWRWKGVILLFTATGGLLTLLFLFIRHMCFQTVNAECLKEQEFS